MPNEKQTGSPLSPMPAPAWLFLVMAIPLVVFAYQGPPIPLPIPAMPLLVAAILLFFTGLLLRREGRSMAELGLSLAPASAIYLLCGLAAGVLLFGTAALLLRTALPFHWERSQAILPLAIAATLGFHLLTNACEELAFRGYAFVGLIGLIGHWPAQAVIAVLTALFHVVCGWSWEVALISTTAGSLLFGLVLVRWRSVPAAIGVHAAWNWSRDLILGVPGGDAAIWHPVGMDGWTTSQWNLAQMILVGTTLIACAAVQLSRLKQARGN
jgi:membrane protease YdiL (CAAX protease family)